MPWPGERRPGRHRVPRAGKGRPRTRSARVLADKGYPSRADRAWLRARGIAATISERDDQIAHDDAGLVDRSTSAMRSAIAAATSSSAAQQAEAVARHRDAHRQTRPQLSSRDHPRRSRARSSRASRESRTRGTRPARSGPRSDPRARPRSRGAILRVANSFERRCCVGVVYRLGCGVGGRYYPRTAVVQATGQAVAAFAAATFGVVGIGLLPVGTLLDALKDWS